MSRGWFVNGGRGSILVQKLYILFVVISAMLFSFIPMILIASIPTRILLYGANLYYLIWQLVIAICFFVVSRVVWKKGLKKYESASS